VNLKTSPEKRARTRYAETGAELAGISYTRFENKQGTQKWKAYKKDKSLDTMEQWSKNFEKIEVIPAPKWALRNLDII
jgi:hypothetical protein